MKADFVKIRNAIERAISLGKNNFIIYPYGVDGWLTKQILNDCFGIKENYIIDNNLSKFNINIKNLDYCKNLNSIQYTVLFACANTNIYEEVRNDLGKYFPDSNIVEIFENISGG